MSVCSATCVHVPRQTKQAFCRPHIAESLLVAAPPPALTGNLVDTASKLLAHQTPVSRTDWARQQQANEERLAVQRSAEHERMAAAGLLLTGLEGFETAEAAQILGLDKHEVTTLIDQAYGDIEKQTSTRVLIIEDEPLVSMDLEGIVEELGHQVASVARTHSQAIDAIQAERPGLVLADIQLADGSSGIDAVREIIQGIEVPVIFITAYPERLLTGERPEPTFLITKPYNPITVKATISQALFFEEHAHL